MNDYEFPPRTLLVPVDFSDRSVAAWSFARRLARAFGAALHGVYVRPMFMGTEIVIPVSLSPAERQALERTMELNYTGAAGLRVDEGDVLLGILRAASRVRADMIVMATGGRTGLKRLLVPSVTEDVVRSSPIPVLAVHGDAAAVRSVLAPVNLTPYSLEARAFAEKVAAALGARLTALYVEEGEPRPALRRRLTAAAPDARVVAGTPVERILEEATKHGLVVMAAHRKGIFRDAVLGSTAEQVLRRCVAPVLTVPPAAAAASSAAVRQGRRASTSPRRRAESPDRKGASHVRRRGPSMLPPRRT